MTGPRTYGDPCGIARALDVVGERWALLVVRELLLGPRRFTDLRAALGASPNVLSQRLGELEANGVVARGTAGGSHYGLTDWGRQLHPILLALGRWGAHAPHRPSGELSVDALMVALQSTFVGAAARELSATLELRVGEESFTADVRDGTLAILRGAPPRPHAVVTAGPKALREVAFGDRDLAAADIELQGDPKIARKFLASFARP